MAPDFEEAHMQIQAVLEKPHSLIASDRVEGTEVRRSDGKKVGTIQRLMIDKLNGEVAYAVLNFGGFFGMGEKHLPVVWERMKFNSSLDAYEINMTEDELSRAPSYAADKEFDWGDRKQEQEIRDYYDVPRYPL
jgi:hypothetical protein